MGAWAGTEGQQGWDGDKRERENCLAGAPRDGTISTLELMRNPSLPRVIWPPLGSEQPLPIPVFGGTNETTGDRQRHGADLGNPNDPAERLIWGFPPLNSPRRDIPGTWEHATAYFEMFNTFLGFCAGLMCSNANPLLNSQEGTFPAYAAKKLENDRVFYLVFTWHLL